MLNWELYDKADLDDGEFNHHYYLFREKEGGPSLVGSFTIATTEDDDERDVIQPKECTLDRRGVTEEEFWSSLQDSKEVPAEFRSFLLANRKNFHQVGVENDPDLGEIVHYSFGRSHDKAFRNKKKYA